MNKFTELGLSQPLVDAISDLGYEAPTPIQAQAIPRLLKNDTDFVGLAQTGTGKTAAFGLPLLDLVDPNKSTTQALILAPTRELGLQIAREFAQFAKNLRKVKIKAVYGGVDIVRQMRDVKQGAHIIVATPGRLRDLMRRRAVDIRNIGYVVLDEADEMLNMGFKEEIDEILEDTPDEKLTWLFSATMPAEVRRISQSYMTDPFELSVGQRNTSNTDIAHQYVISRPRERYEILRRFLDYDPNTFGLVFTRTRRDASELADSLSKDGYRADALHGDLNQSQRDRVMDKFRNRRIQILVATDVAARGIDVNDITHVFHYNIPEDMSFYTHRSGRTGRAGKKGISLVLMHPNDRGLMRRLERIIQSRFEEVKVPTGQDICARQLQTHFDKIKETSIKEEIKPFLPAVLEGLEDLTREELIEKMASMFFKNSLKTYLDTPNFGEKKPFNAGNSRRLFINVGMVDVQDKGQFLSFICSHAQIQGSSIGKINMNRTHTFFDAELDSARKIISTMNEMSHEGRVLRINEDQPKDNNKNSYSRKYKGDKKKKKKKSRHWD